MRTPDRARPSFMPCPGVLLTVVLAGTGCGQRTVLLGRDGAIGDASGNRVPQNHRLVAETCAAERGTRPVPDSCSVDGGTQLTSCLRDSDCREGTNGRCSAMSAGCYTSCSYDDCSADSDCGVRVPCHCRTSPTDFSNNWCVSNSNCSIDADCGPDGYCSPSLVGVLGDCPGCGAGYFCHTANDKCLDDSDCTAGIEPTCAYDFRSGSWACAIVSPYP